MTPFSYQPTKANVPCSNSPHCSLADADALVGEGLDQIARYADEGGAIQAGRTNCAISRLRGPLPLSFCNADNGYSVKLPRLENPCVLIRRPEPVATLIRPWLASIQVIHGWNWEPLG